MVKKTLFYFAILAFLLAACAARPASAPVYDTGQNASPGKAPSVAGESVQNSTGRDYASTIPEVPRMVVKNASLTLAVDKPADSLDRITKMADEMGGYVVSAKVFQTRISSGAEVQQASISIRIPADKLDEALTRIKSETTRPVVSENIDSQDVTKDYTDLGSRLANLQVAEKQLQNLMDQATDTDKVLTVYNQLMQVREQIEVIKGQMQYYEQSAAFSLVSVELMANAAVQPLSIGGWQPVGDVRNAVQALINALKFFAKAGIIIVIDVIPVLVILAIPFLVLFWIIRRLTRRGKPKAPPAPPPAQA